MYTHHVQTTENQQQRRNLEANQRKQAYHT